MCHESTPTRRASFDVALFDITYAQNGRIHPVCAAELKPSWLEPLSLHLYAFARTTAAETPSGGSHEIAKLRNESKPTPRARVATYPRGARTSPPRSRVGLGVRATGPRATEFRPVAQIGRLTPGLRSKPVWRGRSARAAVAGLRRIGPPTELGSAPVAAITQHGSESLDQLRRIIKSVSFATHDSHPTTDRTVAATRPSSRKTVRASYLFYL